MKAVPTIRSRTLFFRMLLAVLVSASAACGASAPSRTACVADADCSSDAVCIENACASTCASDDECPSSQTCQTRVRAPHDSVDVCASIDGTNNGFACMSDTDCEEGERCSIRGVCYVPQEKFALLIRDVTPIDPMNPAPDGGRGADIAAVFLADPQEPTRPVAFGQAIEVVTANEVPVESSVVEGEAPQLEGECVAGEITTATTSLGGAGGYMLVRFLDMTSLEFSVPPNKWWATVVEWGDNCPEGDIEPPDEFEVYLCRASSYETMRPDEHCADKVFGPGSGFVTFEVTVQ